MRIYVAVGDGQILTGIDAVVIGIDINLTAADVEIILAFDAFGVISAGGHADITSADGHASAVCCGAAGSVFHTGFHAFRRGIVAVADLVGVACIIQVFVCTVVIIQSARRHNGDVASADGHDAVAFHALAARAGGCERDGASADVDIAVGTDSASSLCLQIVFVPCAVAAGGHVDDGFFRYIYVALAFDAFGC